MRRSAFIAFLCVAFSVALLGCSDDGDGGDGGDAGGAAGATTTTADEAEPTPGGTLTFGLASETSGYNPTVDQVTLSGYQVAQAVYDRLVAYDEDAQWQPYLAESLEPNDDFTEWTITLRPDVEFHDGTPLTAEVLAQNLQATKDSPLLGQVFRAVDRIEVVDELSVNVVMNTPWSSFPHTLTAQPGLIVAPSVLEEPDGGQRPVGTGPFVLEERVQDQRMIVTRNENYWREGYPLLDRIEFQIISDEVTRAASLESGDIDIMEVRDGAQVAEFESRDDYRVYLGDDGEATEESIFFNTAVPPFDDPLARQAVATAINRDEIAEVTSDGRFPAAVGPYKEASPWYVELDYPEFDVAAAEQLAAEYEAANGEPLSFEILIAPSPATELLVSLVQQQLERAGIEMTIETLEPTQTIVEILGGNFQAGTGNALFGSTHPDREYTFLHGDNALPPGEGLATAFTRVRNPDIDEGLDDARTTDDPEEQAEAWGRVQRALAEELAFLFLTHDEVGDVAHPDVRDVVEWTLPDGTPGLPQEQNVVSLYQVWLAQ
jgi:peptide/nickel transport system substrate-binding protein